MDYDFRQVDELIEKDIANGFPGAVLHISREGKTLKHSSYGYKLRYDREFKTLSKPEPMERDTIFDLASNTKIFATTLILLKLVSEQAINLDNEARYYLPEFPHPKVTLRMLMSHSSGFGPEVLFFSPENHLGAEFFSQDRETTKKLLMKVPLEYEPGTSTVYSDTGFMILGSIIENIYGKRLDETAREMLYSPLNLKTPCFNPNDKSGIAATSIGNTCNGTMNYPNIRLDLIRGDVQDEKAFYCMGGIAGHAGLFFSSSDIIKICELIQETYCSSDRARGFFSKETFLDFINTRSPDETFSCGWRINRGKKVSNLFGIEASELTIGHSGFTGTLSFIDLENYISIVLLTNKVHSYCFDRKRYAGSDFPTGKYAPVIDAALSSILKN